MSTVDEEGMSPTKGEEMGRLPLEFIWVVDCSTSMEGPKIESLNFAIEDSLPEVRKVAADNTSCDIFMRALSFSDGARWHIESRTPLETFRWLPVRADGATDMGRAFDELSKALKAIPSRAVPPVIILMSDGQPTDEWEPQLAEFLNLPWARKAVKVAVGIGSDADMDVLKRFMGYAEAKPLHATNAKDLVHKIKWAATTATGTVTNQKSATSQDKAVDTNVIQAPPPEDVVVDPNDPNAGFVFP